MCEHQVQLEHIKFCHRCKQWKNLKDFPRESRSKDGRQSGCRVCRAVYDATRRANKLKENPNYEREEYLKRKERNRVKYEQWKKEGQIE